MTNSINLMTYCSEVHKEERKGQKGEGRGGKRSVGEGGRRGEKGEESDTEREREWRGCGEDECRMEGQ